ncbi:clathrin adaptor complex small chain-domain-containing protein [Blastocladiella britannica]|nr:clathrin adaptor complex small chain-domain-containing protein [Blastocladiella britannica]
MIRLVLIFNTSGKPRLVKFYDRISPEHQQVLLKRTTDLILARPKNACNFVDPSAALAQNRTSTSAAGAGAAVEPSSYLVDAFDGDSAMAGGDDLGGLAMDGIAAGDDSILPLGALLGVSSASRLKVVYRIYATLVFAMVVDAAEAELAILDLIQVLVEALDAALGPNVCELDLVFNFERAHMLLGEIIQGGLVLETSATRAVENFRSLDKHAKETDGSTSMAGSLLKSTSLFGSRGQPSMT